MPRQIGPYQLGRVLGRGGMGVVFEASRPDLPRSVALKLILPGAAKPTTLERFWREAQALARVQHPGVVRIHALAQDPAGPYLVEELVPGVMLSDLCKAEGLPADRAAKLLHDMADALSAVHAAGIVHRDLKPSNVMVRPGDHPVLLDFGLARAVDAEQLTQTGDLLGTPAYMAPEQAEGGSAGTDARTDVYQLGALGFHLLAGEPPYEGPIYQVLAAILKGDPPTWPESDPTLVAILQRAMARDADARFQTAAALRDALAAYMQGDALPDLPPAPPALAGWLAAAAASLLLTLILVALGARDAPVPEPTSPPTRTRRSEPSATTSPSPAVRPPPKGALWNLRAGDRLEFETWTAEEGLDTRIEMRIRHAATVRLVGGERLEWRSRVKVVSLEVRIGGQVAQAYDSDRDEAGNPFRVLRHGVGLEWTLTLDPLTGSVEKVRGIEAMRSAVGTIEPGASLLAGQRAMYADVCSQSLTDAFIHRHLDSLLRIKQGKRPVWVRRTRRTYAVEVKSGPEVLPSPRFRQLDGGDKQFSLVGQARVTRRGVDQSVLIQTQLEPIRLKDRRLLLSTFEWGFKLVR